MLRYHDAAPLFCFEENPPALDKSWLGSKEQPRHGQRALIFAIGHLASLMAVLVLIK
jgi:hypothetical protein